MKNSDIFSSDEFREACEEYCEKMVADNLNSGPETHEFSEDFEKKMSELLKEPTKNRFRIFNAVGKRVAIVFIAFALIMTTTVFSVKALRVPVIEFFVKIYEEFSALFVDSSDADYNDDFVFEAKEPKLILDGFEAGETIVYDNMYQVEYITDTNIKYYFKQNILYQNQMVDTNEYNEVIETNGIKMYYYNGDYHNKLIWYDSQYSYMVSGNISKKDMIKIAQSVE